MNFLFHVCASEILSKPRKSQPQRQQRQWVTLSEISAILATCISFNKGLSDTMCESFQGNTQCLNFSCINCKILHCSSGKSVKDFDARGCFQCEDLTWKELPWMSVFCFLSGTMPVFFFQPAQLYLLSAKHGINAEGQLHLARNTNKTVKVWRIG